MSQTKKVGAKKSKPAPPKADHAEVDEPKCKYIVGVGASAGGLEALRALFGALKSSDHMSYIVVQHLAPQHRSRLVELIAHATPLKVKEVHDGARPMPGTIYITPPNKDVILQKGSLRLKKPKFEIGPKPSIDLFFNTLAEDAGECAIAIVLSGTGSDGSHGIRAIRAAGGLTMCQNLESAKYDGMPKAAKLTGCVDVEATPEQIAAELQNYDGIEHVIKRESDGSEIDPVTGFHTSGDPFRDILDIVSKELNVDFRDYKQSTIRRRVERRLVANHCKTHEQYAQFLQQKPHEAKILLQDILISVTAFFRDMHAFRILKHYLDQRVKAKPAAQTLRIWVIGCATGEEAYSLAILVSEALDSLKKTLNVQIFATDLDDRALTIARKGIYSKASFADLPKHLVAKYFTPIDERMQIKASLRDWIIFSHHNVISDPPFLNIDLASCRNVLIYFNNNLQQKVFNTIHYALAQGGVLFLGKSENVTSHPEYFEVLDKNAKVFRRLENRRSVPQTVSGLRKESNREINLAKKDREKEGNGLVEMFESLVHGFAPDSVVVDEEFRVKRFHGDVSNYLGYPKGEATQNIVKLVPEDVSLELSSILHRVQKGNERIEGRVHQLPAHRQAVRLVVIPLNANHRRHYLVVFQRQPKDVFDVKLKKGEANTRAVDRKIFKLEQELANTHEQLQSVIEEQETSKEELQSLNEELQSANEELQSSNEELETTNEELQSSNEELTTLNQELNVKSTEHQILNQRLQAIQNAIVYPLLIIDKNEHLVNFNPAARYLLRIGDGDIGSHIKAVPSQVDLTPINQLVDSALKGEKDEQFQFKAKDRSFEVQIQLFRGVRDAIEGAVVSMVENTAISSALDESKLIRRRLSDILENTPAVVTMKDLSGVYVYVNRHFCSLIGKDQDDIIGRTAEEVFGSQIGDSNREKDYETIKKKRALQFEEQWEINGKTHHWASSCFPIFDTRQRVQWVCTISLDITERVLHEKQLELFKRAISSANIGILIFQADNEDYRSTFVSSYLVQQLARSGGRSMLGLQLASFLENLKIVGNFEQLKHIATQIRSNPDTSFLLNVESLGGQKDAWIELRSSLLKSNDLSLNHLIVTIFDVTERIKAQRTILQQQEELTRFAKFSTLGEIAAGIGHEINTPLNVITTKTDLLRKLGKAGRLDEAHSEKIAGDIDRISKNISSIVNGLKNVASADPEKFERASLRQIIQDTLKTCEFRIHRFAVEVKLDGFEKGDIEVDCYPVQVTQIMINLINNAIEAVAEMSPRWIKVSVVDKGDWVWVRVSDSGGGIEQELTEKIMTPFFTTKKKGTGIGLSLSRSIARRHGGDLVLETEASNTTFRIEIPKKQSERNRALHEH